MTARVPPPPPSAAGPDRAALRADAPSGADRAATFEESMKRLAEIVQTLERGDLPLEESLRLFEEGVRLSRLSQERLDAAQRKVEQLLGVDEQGRPRTQPFATQAAANESGPPRADDDEIPF